MKNGSFLPVVFHWEKCQWPNRKAKINDIDTLSRSHVQWFQKDF